MKLKLEQHENGTILTVFESIQPEQVAVIKAGLVKVLRPNRPLLMDLCGLPGSDLHSEILASELLALKAWAIVQNHEILVAAPAPLLGDVSTRELGLQLLESAPDRAAALMAVGSLYIEKLQRQKHSLEKKLAALEPAASDLRKLRKKNSDLRKRIQFTESQLEALGPIPSAPAAYADPAARLRTIEQTLLRVFNQQNLMGASSA